MKKPFICSSTPDKRARAFQLASVCVVLLAFPSAGHSSEPHVSVSKCRPLGQLGTDTAIDYNDPTTRDRLAVVETHHFDQNVQTLSRGETSVEPALDLDFVLRYVPNHYQALALMGQRQLMIASKSVKPSSELANIEPASCYFERAIMFRPDDAQLHALYAVYLHRAGKLQQAELEYLSAERLGAASADLYYNLGLLMLDRGDIARAKIYAEKAYSLGYPLPGLRNKLRHASSSKP